MKMFYYQFITTLLSGIFLIGVSNQLFAQHPEDFKLLISKRHSLNTYIFNIENERAEVLYKNGLYLIDSSFFHTLVDSFKIDSVYRKPLDFGHYLFVEARENQLYYEIISENQVDIKLLNNQTDLAILVHDTAGNTIVDAEVFVQQKKLKLNPETNTFINRKRQKDGWVKVNYNGQSHFFYIEKNKKNSWIKRTKNNIIYSVPISYIWVPFYNFGRNIYRSVKWGEPHGVVRKVFGIFDEDYRNNSSFYNYKKKFRGFMVLNQPKYRPADTVKLKAIITRKKGKGISKKLDLWIAQYGSKDTHLGKVSPYRKGGYSYQFILHDSLRLNLDRNAEIILKYKDKSVMSTYLHYEDYELDNVNFTSRLAKETVYKGEKQSVILQAKDANQLNVLDGKAQISVLSPSIFTYYSDSLFVPDTLWRHEVSLEAIGETKVNIPDSIFGNVDLAYKIHTFFTNADNEIHQGNLNGKFFKDYRPIELKLEKDSLFVDYGNPEALKTRKGMLLEWQENELIFKQEISLSDKIKLNPYATNYQLKTDSITINIAISNEQERIECLTHRTQDSVKIIMENPRKLPFWYTIYRNNKIIAEGNATSLDFSRKSNLRENYFIAYNYIWAGNKKEQSYSIPYRRKDLDVKIIHPQKVYPGQEVEMNILVSNHAGKPLPNIDLTAYAYTGKFEADNSPDLPAWYIKSKNRKYYNEFSFPYYDVFQENGQTLLDFDFWEKTMKLDSLEYYNFLYPENGFYQFEMPALDSITQFSPHVVANGYGIPVYTITVDNQLIYFKDTDHLKRYSFQLDSGAHKIELRTSNEYLKIDSFYIPHQKKTIFSLDLDNLPEFVHCDTLGKFFTQWEQDKLNRTLILYKNKFYADTSYFKQQDKIYAIPGNAGHHFNHSPKTDLVIGPFRPLPMTFVSPDYFKIRLDWEPFYGYDLYPGKIKMKFNDKIIGNNYFLNDSRETPWINDWVLRESELLRPHWEKPKDTFELPQLIEEDIFTIDYFINQNWREIPGSVNSGHFVFEFDKPNHRIQEVILFHKEKLQVKSISGNIRKIENLPAGNYQMIFLLDSNRYFTKKQIEIVPNGINFLRLNPEKIHTSVKPFHQPVPKSDSVVFYLSENSNFISGKITGMDGYPLIGAIITLKNQHLGTFSSIDGNFKIKANPGDTLTINCSDKKIRDIPINAYGHYKIALQTIDTLQVLKEISIVGYATRRKANMTASIATTHGGIYHASSLIAPGGYKKISGTVKSEDGEPLPGVSILIRGTAEGTVSDIDGNYSIDVPVGASLIFSYIGFTTNEIRVNRQNYMDISLVPDIQALEEVVVVGYGVSRRLEGRASGVTVTNAPTIKIRGANSISAENNPLIIINGVPYAGKLSDFTSDSILTVDVLKGEQATAIYGSRAAEGIIIVVTKSGIQPKTSEDTFQPFGATQSPSGLRQNFSDYAFWEPQLITDQFGKATFTAKFPDDITGWDTHVIAVGKKKLSGKTNSFIQSFKPLAANLTLPRFLVKGDSTQLIGKILNYEQDSVKVNSFFELNNQKLASWSHWVKDAQIDSVYISATSEDTIAVKYQIERENGYFDGELREIPVYQIGVSESIGDFMVLNTDTSVTISPKEGFNNWTLQVNGNVFEVLLDELKHIQDYPYACNEQSASKLKAYLMEKKIREELGQDFKHNKDILKLVDKLENAQKQDGSWGWWPNSSSNIWMTSYVADALLKAESAGFAGTKYLDKTANYLYNNLEVVSHEQQLDILKTLTFLEYPISYQRSLDLITKDTTLDLYSFMKLQELRKIHQLDYQLDTLKKLQKETLFGGVYWGEEKYWFEKNAIITTLMAYRLLEDEQEFEGYREKIRNYFLEKKRSGYWRNTSESAQILETILPDIIKGKKNNQTESKLVLSGAIEQIITEFPYQLESDKPQNLTISKSGNLPIFVMSSQTFWNKTPEKVDQEFEVNTYFEEDSSALVHLESGKRITLVAEVKVLKKSEYVMIEIPIPAGCSYGDKHAGNNYWLEAHREYFRDKVSIFCENLNPGTYSFQVNLETRYPGTYTVNPAKAEQMYFPVFFGREKMKKVEMD
ncbi:carboxypeptidase-like regulatory domain-containing protein [Flexithrix dorotheae]|uniref:carboxypeptidase-like regulatory domain-containing protein n=1 Tax=Flexithrix dorotheae TaxID=70993 RepID=UPI00039F3C9C|nr:carboxypeptidase-like regulatory domain-containing protein [Flexithrix dorotheae]